MSAKKKILFTINSMNVGGVEKALISLLHDLDYSKFDVDLQLFKKEGLFLSDIPLEVNILEVPTNYQYFDCSYKKVIKTLNPNLIFNRYKFKSSKSKAKTPTEREQLAWKYVGKTIKPLSKFYDVAIGYLENTPIFFTVDKVRAGKKIGFIHNDYKNIKSNPALDMPYFEKLDNICSVSDHCVEILKSTFPLLKGKIKLIPNVFSEHLILKNSEESVTEVQINVNLFNIVSIGRLAEQKGFDLAIQVAGILKEKHFSFNWFILGEGPLREELENKIKDSNVEDCLFLLGNQPNPYKFMKFADLIVQTSIFEGKSIAIDEAKLLNKIILVTSYPTAKDQIMNNIDGFISNFSPDEIADRIISLAKDDFLTENIVKYLKDNRLQKENKILELF